MMENTANNGIMAYKDDGYPTSNNHSSRQSQFQLQDSLANNTSIHPATLTAQTPPKHSKMTTSVPIASYGNNSEAAQGVRSQLLPDFDGKFIPPQIQDVAR
jgi:hypothetical protein